MPIATVNEIEIDFEVYGEGEPLAAIGGPMFDRDGYRDIATAPPTPALGPVPTRIPGRGSAASLSRVVTGSTDQAKAEAALGRLRAVLDAIPRRTIACSGGVDSLVLAAVAHRADPKGTLVAHTVTPAVPADATARVVHYASVEGWRLELVRSAEFEDERYLANPVDRCYYCKTNLYDALDDLTKQPDTSDQVVLSGANTDDLGEYRPGLQAAAEHDVRHPYLEAQIAKAEVRAIARSLALDVADLPASPCLASRLYTGTRVSAERLQAVEVGEATVREATGLGTVRCRIRDDQVLVEVPEADRPLITPEVLAASGRAMQAVMPSLGDPTLDGRPYKAGQAILQVR